MANACNHSGFCDPEVANDAIAALAVLANTPLSRINIAELQAHAQEVLRAWEKADHDS